MKTTQDIVLLDGGMGRELKARGVRLSPRIWSASALLELTSGGFRPWQHLRPDLPDGGRLLQVLLQPYPAPGEPAARPSADWPSTAADR